jgi:modification methylase
MTRHLIYIADSRRVPELADESVQLVVTSPPYWSLKDYGHPGQIGHGQEYEEYLESVGQVLGECHRVLCEGCRMAVNVGDQYLRASEHGRYRVLPLGADLTALARGLEFDFMGSIIWRKVSTTRPSGGGKWMGSIYIPRDGQITYEHEYILIFRKPGKAPRPSEEIQEKSRLTKEQRQQWFRGVWADLPPERQTGHEAMFPVELPRRLIKMYSFYGETVLDPFLGSGTTCLAAAVEGRHCIGYEINRDYAETITQKMRPKLCRLAGPETEPCEVEFITPQR